METQNVTLALPKEVLRKARMKAVAQQTSLSAIMTELLTDFVGSDERYAAARQRSREIRERGLPFNTYGTITWTRDELHERR
jgi:hypothetical protein